MTITAAQCRAARAMLDWSRDDLAAAAQVAKRTVVDFERGARSPIHSTLDVLRRALEAAGIEFLDGDGVRLKASPESSAPPEKVPEAGRSRGGKAKERAQP